MSTTMGKHLVEKRIKITKRGKILRRSSHIGHNLSKKTPKVKRQKQKLISVEHHRKNIYKILH